MVNFEGEMGPSQDIPGHVRQSIYSKRLSRGQNRYGADADLGVLNSGTHWCNLANTMEQSVWAAAMRPYGQMLVDFLTSAASEVL